jgi:uncharacterized protein (TIGR02588 family)
MNQRRRPAKSAAVNDTPPLEWLLGAIGAALVIAGLIYLLWQASTPQTPADVQLRVDDVVALERGYLVRFSAHNVGAETLADLHVTARLHAQEQEIERAQLTIDYLPGHSLRKGGFFLRHDPRAHELELSAEGFQAP